MNPNLEEKVVATGTWLYDGTIPKRIAIYKVPAKFSCTRYDEDDELIDSRPIPNTPDGFVYKSSCGGEEHTLEEMKAWANSQPWGPCSWDQKLPQSLERKRKTKIIFKWLIAIILFSFLINFILLIFSKTSFGEFFVQSIVLSCFCILLTLINYLKKVKETKSSKTSVLNFILFMLVISFIAFKIFSKKTPQIPVGDFGSSPYESHDQKDGE